MTKTPEELAEEYADNWHKDCDYPAEILRHTKKATETVFLAGYQAGRLNSEGVQAAQPQWISVKERLPEENDEVLIYTEGKYIYMARIYKGNEAYPISNGCGCCEKEERYTHWMPLPEPPKE